MNIYKDSKELETITYPDGAIQVRIKPEYFHLFNNEDTFNIWWNTTGYLDDLMWIGLAKDAIERYKEFPITVNLIVPYLPYARADRRFVTGDCFGLKVFGNIINSMIFDKVITFDVHNYHVASRAINRLINISPEPLIESILENIDIPFTILLPDEGAKKRYNFNETYKPHVKCCSKIRDPKTGKLSGFKVPSGLKGHVVIVDDLCDGGGTFLGIADKVPKECTLSLYTSHGLYSKGISDLHLMFHNIYTTDSIYNERFGKVVNTIKLEPYINENYNL